jgi:arsenate reductase-like glutaredoxin family protein
MEIKFIYNSNQIKEREALGYIKSLDQHYINEFNVNKEQFTQRQLADLAQKLKVSVKELINKESEFYQDDMEDSNYDDNDILGLIKRKPALLKTPIVEYGKSAKFISSPYEFNNLDMTFNSISEELSNKDEK